MSGAAEVATAPWHLQASEEEDLGRDTILICGTLTNYCCGTTARQGYERGFHVVVGSDVCATDDPAMQEPELKVLRKGFARVLTAEEVMAAVDVERADEGRGGP